MITEPGGPQQQDSKSEKGQENMSAEELISKMYELQNKASDAFRHGRDVEEVERLDAEEEKLHDAFMKLTGQNFVGME